MRRNNYSATAHGGGAAVNSRPASNWHHSRPPYAYSRSNFPANSRGYRPPDHRPPPPQQPYRPPNFVVDLHRRRGSAAGNRRAAVESLISKCRSPPEKYFTFDGDEVAGRLFFSQWSCALEAVVGFWESLLNGAHKFKPVLKPNVIVPSDKDEYDDRLKLLFSEKIRGLVYGELVKKWEKKVEKLEKKIVSVCAKRRFVAMEVYEEKKRYVSEKGLIMKRIDEFRSGMNCILCHIKGSKGEVFKFNDELDWYRIYSLMMRECQRLDSGLPIYAFRRDILRRVRSQQITVLNGETGSGKSTQLIQFLADSGVVADGSIICTQPRKVAAISLADRVQEESYGCYEIDVIGCYPSYSSAQQFKGQLIYMTDNCLLQHCMNDRNLRGVSCILVDEAHERSLNTDLLLALLKNLLLSRSDLRLIIMSATADSKQLSEYFCGCGTFSVVGRSFPVDVRYVPCLSEGTSQLGSSAGNVAPYVHAVVKKVREIHVTEPEGTILAFLTAPLEVEWACEDFKGACENLKGRSAETLALHGKLSNEEQLRVFQDYPGKRKVIFATNVAETSLTIPGVKYVVDSGMVKESRFEPGSGMNVVRVCWISKSSASQRAGRAGRTEPGICYRLYSQDDFDCMAAQQEPEIRRVHLGVAVLKIIALGVRNVQEFDFVDAPSPEAIDTAIRNLVQLGAVILRNGNIELTDDGQHLVKLGIEPRLGKFILTCFSAQLGREGLVLAAVMANSSNIFFRVGSHSEKLKSDCLKVPFCHRAGDLFTLLSVYKAWEDVPFRKRNEWCVENSINAKSMRRCQDTVIELENCLKHELRMIIPSYWYWRPEVVTEYDKNLQKAILASLADNVAMYSGSDQLGYIVALTGQHVQLQSACSLLVFNHKPEWVVFGEIVSATNQYLACVTAFDREFLSTLSPPPLFDVSELESQKLQVTRLSGFGKTLLKKLCGRSNYGLLCRVQQVRRIFGDKRIGVEVDVDNDEIQISCSSRDMEKVLNHVKNAVECEKRWLQSECMERSLYHGGPGINPPVALLGSGAEIKHLELDKRCLTVDVLYHSVDAVDDKDLLMFIESFASGICAVHKSTARNQEAGEREKWGSITFLTPDAADRAAARLNNVEFNGSALTVKLSGATFGVDRAFSFPHLKAKLSWPRKPSKGSAAVKCDIRDVSLLVSQFSNLRFGEKYVRSEPSKKFQDSVMIMGFDKEASEPEIWQALLSATNRRIWGLKLFRGDPVDNLSSRACAELIFREISVFMPKGSPQINFCRVEVSPPEEKDVFMRATITFDGRLHLEAAKALEHIEGKVLPGFLPWQKIECHRSFHSSVFCPSSVYSVIQRELDPLVARFNRRVGTQCEKREISKGIRVIISATATKTVAELRGALEELMKGRTITHASLSPAVLQHLYYREGSSLMRSIEKELGVCILFDKKSLNVKVYGPSVKTVIAEERFIQRLLSLHENKQLEIHLRGGTLPYDLMKEVVKRFGPNLQGLKEKVPEAEFTLNTRRHIINICGNKEAKQKVEAIIAEVAQAGPHSTGGPTADGETPCCPICLCEVEEEYKLESCLHVFCHSCLVEQCESAIRNNDSFPICCTHGGCGAPLLVVDLKSLLSGEKLDELFLASLGAFVASSGGKYRFCPSPDCPSVYRVAGPGELGKPFTCQACYVETCTSCHLEYHPYLSCEKYKEYKEDPDSSLKQWCCGKEEYVKRCTVCGYTIEKAEGCNHVECRCGRHLCWVCLEYFVTADDCYNHLRAIHQGIT